MSKKSREAIRSNLERAISPPPQPRKRGSNLDGLLDEYAPPDDASPKSRVSHAPNVSLDAKISDLWASIPETKGYSKQFHAITDHLFRLLDPIEQAIYTQLFQLTHGFSKPTCVISLPRLAERANIGTTAAHGAIKRLVTKGLVEKRTWIVGRGKEQGIEFSLPLPAWLTLDVSHTPDEPNKRNTLKEDVLQELL